MPCPKCGFENDGDALECVRCGVIFSKLVDPQPRTTARSGATEAPVADGRFGPAEIRILGFGFIAAVIVYAIPLTRFIFSALITLFHELGHAAMGWLLGYPSLPAFDFIYGGGLTHHGEFRPSIVVAVAAGFAYAAWLFRQNRKSVAIITALFLLWLFIVTNEWRRETAFAAAGHAAELILAGVLFYKALANVGWRIPELERPLGAFVAFFIQIDAMLFASKLTRDASFAAEYREGKGGALMNDLEIVALNLQIWLGVVPGIDGVARWLLMFSVVPTAVAIVWYLERARWHRVMRALATAES